jgi:hypothetical protein
MVSVVGVFSAQRAGGPRGGLSVSDSQEDYAQDSERNTHG